jgi:hypothetical protein
MGDSIGNRHIVTVVTIRKRIITFFMDYPNSSPKEACLRLGLDYSKHGHYVRSLKNFVKRNHFTDTNGDSLVEHQQPPKISPFLENYSIATKPRIHLLEMSLSEPLKPEHLSALERAAKEQRGGWSLSSNRNGMLVFRGSGIALKVWKTGTLRLASSLQDGSGAISAFIEALSVALPRSTSIVYSSKLQYLGHHEVFRVGKTFLVSNPNPFIEIKAVARDGSHPNDLELHCRRKVPAPLILPWIKEALV